jgi:hypothetical protein
LNNDRKEKVIMGSDNVLGVNTIVISSEELAKVEMPELSDEVCQIIIQSGVKSLQSLVEANKQEAIAKILQEYWEGK